jgi:hypothetical protein
MPCRVTALMFSVVVAVVSLATARADDGGLVRQVGDIIYTVPAGWSKSGGSGYVELATDDKARFPVHCTMRIYPSVLKAEFDGGAEAFLRERMRADLAEMVADDKDTRIFGPERKDTTTVGQTPALAIARGIENGRRRMELYYVLDRPTRFAVIRFVAPARDHDTAAAVSKVIEGPVRATLASLRFVGEDAKPLLGAPKPGPLDGVWWGTGLENRYGVNGLELQRITSAYTFRADGRFLRGVPDQQIEDLDFKRLIRERTGAVGNYRVVGDKLMLDYADGDARSLHFHPGSNVVRDGKVTMTAARLPHDGFTFEGTRTRTHYTSFSTGLSSTGGVGGERTWVYRKDGTFTSDRSVSVTGSYDQGGGFAGQSNRDKIPGRYRVIDGKLETTEAGEDGKPETSRTTILLFGGNDGEPPEIIIGGDVIKPLKPE